MTSAKARLRIIPEWHHKRAFPIVTFQGEWKGSVSERNKVVEGYSSLVVGKNMEVADCWTRVEFYPWGLSSKKPPKYFVNDYVEIILILAEDVEIIACT